MRRLFSLAVVTMIAGCATITTGQNQPVSVETPGCQGATCKLSNDKGTWFVSTTPGSATVQRAYGDMTVTCEKGDYRSNPYIVKSSTKGMAFGNIIFGGLIGAAVDAGSGAAYDYPTLITVGMICSGDPKTVMQPTQPPAQENANAGSGSTQIEPPSASLQQATEKRAPRDTSTGTGYPSKYMFAAERMAKSLGCVQPVASLSSQTATSEMFTIACGPGHDALFIRCENGDCRQLK